MAKRKAREEGQGGLGFFNDEYNPESFEFYGEKIRFRFRSKSEPDKEPYRTEIGAEPGADNCNCPGYRLVKMSRGETCIHIDKGREFYDVLMGQREPVGV